MYDLGAGTFDTAVLERTDDGFVLHGEPGGLETGGDSFDERLYAYLGRQIDPADWDALQNSNERSWRRAQADFRRWIRLAKEALSTNPRGVDIQYPGPADRDPLWLTADELHEQLRPELEKTVDELERTMRAAGIDGDRVSAVYLAGGSSKIPLVETLIVDRFGKSARLEDDRKQVVALGAAAAPTSAIAEHDEAVVDRAPAPAPASSGTEPASEPLAPARESQEAPSSVPPATPAPATPATIAPSATLASTAPPASTVAADGSSASSASGTTPPPAPPAGPGWLPPPRPAADPSGPKSRLPVIGGGIAAAVVIGLAAIALAQGGPGGASPTPPPVGQNETDAPTQPPVASDPPGITEPPVSDPPTAPPETPPPGWSDGDLSLWRSFYSIDPDVCEPPEDPAVSGGGMVLAVVECTFPPGPVDATEYLSYASTAEAENYLEFQPWDVLEDTRWSATASDGTSIGGRQMAFDWRNGAFSIAWTHDENPFAVHVMSYDGDASLLDVANQIRTVDYDPTP